MKILESLHQALSASPSVAVSKSTIVGDAMLQALGEALQADDSQHAYLLIDPIGRIPLAVSLLERNRCEVTDVLLDQNPSARHLQLVHMRPQAFEVLAESLRIARDERHSPVREAGRGHAICGWLLSSSAPARLARHLTSRIQRNVADSHGYRSLRWFSAWILEWMWPALAEPQRSALLGPIRAWHALDSRGQIAIYTVAGSMDAPPLDVLSLTAGQRERLDEAPLAYALLRSWRQSCTALPENYLVRVEHALMALRPLRLGTVQDTVLLGSLILMVHPDLLSHERIDLVLREARDASHPLAQALLSIPDPSGWEQIAQDLNERRPSFSRL